MSLFAEMESQEPEKRGLLGRLKAFKAGFTDSSSSAMPIVGREPVDGGSKTGRVGAARRGRLVSCAARTQLAGLASERFVAGDDGMDGDRRRRRHRGWSPRGHADGLHDRRRR